MSNITQVVNTGKNMTTLKKAVTASGLDTFLSGTGPFTVFAPTDLAFEKLGKEVLEKFLKPENETKLFKDLKDGEKKKTVNGKELRAQVKDDNVSVEGAKIESRDVQTSNVVIHSLDTVTMRN